MMTDLAGLLTIVDEFLRSSDEVTALLERFMAARGEQHAGSRTSLIIDWAAIGTERRLNHFLG